MNQSIQLLRGISIVYILILHSTFMWTPKLHDIYLGLFDTASGVELFFCIAGYFSAKKIFSYQIYNFETCINYIVGRLKRLSPLLFVWATIMFLWGGISDPVKWGTHDFLYGRLIGTFLYIRNFQEVVMPNAFGYFWAVSLEMQYFCIFSLFVLVVKRKWVVPGLSLLFIIFSFFRPSLLSSPYFRIDGLILGSILFLFQDKFNKIDLSYKFILGNNTFEFLIFFILLLSLASSLLILKDFPLFKCTVTSIIAFILVFLAVRKSDVISFKIKFVDMIFEKIGDYSFSLYVVHIITWWISSDILHWIYPVHSNIVEFLFAVVLMLICSFFSKKWFENLLR